MIGVVRLMYMAEDGKPYFPGCGYSLEEFLAIVEANSIQPPAAHRYGWMMQADHDVRRIGFGNDRIQSVEFLRREMATCPSRRAAVDARYKPVVGLQGGAIMKRWFRQRFLHQGTNIVIARYAVDLELQAAEQAAEVLVSFRAVILNQVASDDGQVGLPVAVTIVIEHGAQRRIGDSAAQVFSGVGKQVRIRQVQDPQRTRCVVDMRELRAISVPIVFRLVRALLRNTDVIGLLIGQFGDLRADAAKMQARDLLVKVFG